MTILTPPTTIIFALQLKEMAALPILVDYSSTYLPRGLLGNWSYGVRLLFPFNLIRMKATATTHIPRTRGIATVSAVL